MNSSNVTSRPMGSPSRATMISPDFLATSSSPGQLAFDNAWISILPLQCIPRIQSYKCAAHCNCLFSNHSPFARPLISTHRSFCFSKLLSNTTSYLIQSRRPSSVDLDRCGVVLEPPSEIPVTSQREALTLQIQNSN